MIEDNRFVKARNEYLGKRYKTADGKEFEIIEYNSYGDVTVQIVGSDYKIHTKISNILNGKVKNPFAKSVVAFDTVEQELVGCLFKTNSGDTIKILKAPSKKDVTFQILDEFGYIGTTTIQNIKNGQIHNPFKRSPLDRSYIGVGPYGNDSQYNQLKNLWKNLTVRATGARIKYNKTSIVNTSICDDLLCFNKFANWFLETSAMLNPSYLYSIDRVLLYKYYRWQTNDMFFYCPDTLELIPDILAEKIKNSIIKGNSNQKELILSLSEKYYSAKALSDRAYFAIQNQYNNGNYNISVIVNPYYLKDLYTNALGLKYREEM